MQMDLRPGQVLKERYEIQESLGEGGFATVFKARDLELNREVAIKILKTTWGASDQDRFRREAKILAQLQHRNIVSVYSFDALDDATSMIVMEYLQGQSLKSLLYSGETPDYEVCKNILLQVSDGLAYAHKAGLVHRDLSSLNIYILKEGNSYTAKIIDFGLSRLFLDDSGAGKLTETGVILGNPPYMSPELASGQQVNHLTDIYSLGCIFYEVTTGKLPFDAENSIGILFMQQKEYPPAPSFLWKNKDKGAHFDLLLLRCLQKDPARRFQSCDELAEALKKELSEADAEALKQKLQLHDWAGAEKSKSRSVLPGLLAISIAVALPILFQDNILTALGQAVSTHALKVPPKIEADLAAHLLNRKQPELASSLYADLMTNSDSETAVTRRDFALAAAEAYRAAGDRKQFSNYLQQSLSFNEELKNQDAVDYLFKAFRLVEQSFQEQPATNEELNFRAEILMQLAKNPASSFQVLSKNFRILLPRTIKASRARKGPNLHAIDALTATLLRTKIILQSPEQSNLDELTHQLVDCPNLLQLQKARSSNLGTPLEVKVNVDYDIVSREDDLALRKQGFLRLLPASSEFPLRKMQTLMDIAELSMKMGDEKDALKYLQMAKEYAKSADAVGNLKHEILWGFTEAEILNHYQPDKLKACLEKVLGDVSLLQEHSNIFEMQTHDSGGSSTLPIAKLYVKRSESIFVDAQKNNCNSLAMLLAYGRQFDDLEEKTLLLSSKYLKRFGYDEKFDAQVKDYRKRIRNGEIKRRKSLEYLRVLLDASTDDPAAKAEDKALIDEAIKKASK